MCIRDRVDILPQKEAAVTNQPLADRAQAEILHCLRCGPLKGILPFTLVQRLKNHALSLALRLHSRLGKAHRLALPEEAAYSAAQ